MMKILHVVRPAEGGMKNHVLSLLRHLDKRKYRMILACPQAEEWRSLLADSDVEVVELSLKGNLSLVSDMQNVLQLKHLIKEQEVDLVHTHGMKAGLVGRIAGCSLKGRFMPYILSTIHNSIYQYRMPVYQKHVISTVQRCLARQTDGFITVSQALKREIMLWEGVPQDKIRVIYNGIKTDMFHKSLSPYHKIRLGLNPALPVVGMVARLAPQKGADYFVQAAYLISQVIDSVQFLVAGDGPLKEELQREAVKLGIKDKIIFAGHQADTSEIYPLIDVYAAPSISEGLSTGVIEAMAAKRPIVATAVGGIPELITHRETGLLIPPGNPQALAQGILELLKRPIWSAQLAKSARQKAVHQFTMENMVGQTEDFYQRIVEGREIRDVHRRYAHG